MPTTMLQLAVVQFYRSAFFSVVVYTTAAVAQNAYNSIDPTSKNFQDAGDWVNIMFMVYNGVAALAALFITHVSRENQQAIYSHVLSHHWRNWFNSLFSLLRIITCCCYLWFGLGLVWASTLTMPYAILAGALPANKMGIFIWGVFLISLLLIPQIVGCRQYLAFLSKMFLMIKVFTHLLLVEFQ